MNECPEKTAIRTRIYILTFQKKFLSLIFNLFLILLHADFSILE